MLLGACNSPYTEIPHVLGRAGWGCPKHYPSQSGLLRADTRALGYDNVHLHYTKRGDPVRYLHRSVPDNGYAERYYVPQILAGTHPEPMPGGWWGGYLKTKPFLVWLGTGENAVARMDYELGSARKEFRFRRMSQDRSVRGRLTLANPELEAWTVKVNDKVVQNNARTPDIVVDFGLDDVLVMERNTNQITLGPWADQRSYGNGAPGR